MLPEDLTYLDQAGAAYIEEIRELEALFRPLWGVIALEISDEATTETRRYMTELKRRLASRTLPEINTNNRQIAVEMAVLAFGVGVGREKFLEYFSKEEQGYLFDWMNAVNTIEFPVGNWFFFSILINTALKAVGANYSEEEIVKKTAVIEELYLGDGWYSDGKNQQRDYYVAFAFHFYGLLYGMILQDTQAERYKKRALIFSKDFVRWFDAKGRSLPYGRSLTYRFAHVAFWSALVLSGAYKESDFSLGEIKGLIFRNLRWWQKQTITLPKEKNLSVGYGYNQLVMSEDYNAPGSPMWAFKAFILLSLPEEHPFWRTTEEPYPEISRLNYQKHSGFLMCGDAASEHHVALSGLQFSGNPQLLHHREKYGKFAYSTYFGFNISRDDATIEQVAVDSALTLSIAGVNQFTARDSIKSCTYQDGYVCSSWEIPGVAKVRTFLIPAEENCHIRIHEVQANYVLDAYDGGFPLFHWNRKYNQAMYGESSVFLENEAGTSGVEDLLGTGKATVVPQNPNSNIYDPEKNAVPAILHRLARGKSVIATLVFGSPDRKAEAPLVEMQMEADKYVLDIVRNRKILIHRDDSFSL